MSTVQILCIHGGMTFKNEEDYLGYLRTRPVSFEPKKSWSESLGRLLGDEYQVVLPQMPLKENAKYAEWKIVFERHLELLSAPFVLVGNSLGGIFLARYLSENILAHKALSVYLVCPPFDDTLPGEDLAGGFELGDSLKRITENTARTVLCFSADDDVVPLAHAKKYQKHLPDAEFYIFENKNGHFKIEEFSEIAEMIRQDTTRA